MTLEFASDSAAAVPLFVFSPDVLTAWLVNQPDRIATWVNSAGFAAKIGQTLIIPALDGRAEAALVGYGTEITRARGRFHFAAAAAKLPIGDYRLDIEKSVALSPDTLANEALGWLLASYAFDRYATQSTTKARLVAPAGIDAKSIEIIAAGEALTRDLINTPANDMGPDALEHACATLTAQHNAAINVIHGDDLIDQNFPLIHAVGRASDQSPRLIDINWGDSGPTLTLVGKGVCFDTGGLNLKPGASMGLMKKDMGGAATVLGLAHMIMGLGLALRLRVLIPAVENSVSSNAMRPGDILQSRKGLSIEINNTDAEGRLVLADALTFAAEDNPDMMISMATLTGAARVAVGPDLSPYYCDDQTMISALELAATRVADPVWRMPFWTPYESMIEPGIADLDNAPKGGFAGSITAALFLRRFVSDPAHYTHFDIYGWNPSPAAARPKGGVGMASRALLAALPDALNL